MENHDMHGVVTSIERNSSSFAGIFQVGALSFFVNPGSIHYSTTTAPLFYVHQLSSKKLCPKS